MKEGSFKIATDAGDKTVHGCTGEFIGIDDRTGKGDWRATVLHTGTSCNSLFKTQLDVLAVINSPEDLGRLIGAVDRLELLCAVHFYGLYDLPWGAEDLLPHHEETVAQIRKAAQA